MNEPSEAYNLIDTYITNRRQSIWNNETNGPHCREIVYNVSTKVKYSHTYQNTEVITTRLRLEKCHSNTRLYQICTHADGLCAICNQPETVTPFLTECSHKSTLSCSC